MTDDPAALLRLYDDQLRAHIHDREPESVRYDRDGPVLRITGGGPTGWVMYRDLDGLDGAALDAFIRRQIEYFAKRELKFEWKYRGHDLPIDLPERLRAAGFVPEEQETLLVAPIHRIALDASPPDGVVIREVGDDADERADYDRIEALESAVWGDAGTEGWMTGLAAEKDADPEGVGIFLAVAGDLAVSAGWIRFPSATDFGTLWGGSTLPEWRGRGIYRSLVARRARVAAERGRRYLQVDASDESRPILERLGFIAVGTTTPYIWTPPG